MGLHARRGFIDDIIDVVQSVMVRAHIGRISSSQYVILATDLTKDQLMKFTEHVDFSLVERAQMHKVWLRGQSKLGDVLGRRGKSRFGSKS